MRRKIRRKPTKEGRKEDTNEAIKRKSLIRMKRKEKKREGRQAGRQAGGGEKKNVKKYQIISDVIRQFTSTLHLFNFHNKSPFRCCFHRIPLLGVHKNSFVKKRKDLNRNIYKYRGTIFVIACQMISSLLEC